MSTSSAARARSWSPGGATNADRPIPLISFVARQYDLRDLVGENLAGVVQVQFCDVLKHWEARFHRITLEDHNLSAIAEKRVPRVSEAARQTMQAAFDDILKMRKDVLDTLLTTVAESCTSSVSLARWLKRVGGQRWRNRA